MRTSEACSPACVPATAFVPDVLDEAGRDDDEASDEEPLVLEAELAVGAGVPAGAPLEDGAEELPDEVAVGSKAEKATDEVAVPLGGLTRITSV